MKQFTVTEIEGWQEVVENILPLRHNIFLLKGNLGAGKTTFTQYLLRELGSTEDISSPTYSIVNEYRLPQGKVFHFDLYRMKDITEVFDIGMEEYLDSGALCIIEWPEIYERELEGIPYHEIRIENNGSERTVNFI